jgi:23S rRNA-/tRNA-specific pseudouridylate synthase
MPRTAMLFRPHTGKTHQLLVAAKSLAMPILGDVRYGGGRLLVGGVSSSSPPPDCGDDEDRGDWDRTYLHASAVHFEFDEHEIVTIWSPPPFDRLATGLNDVFVRMMEKHCDCPPILDAIHKRSAMNEK